MEPEITSLDALTDQEQGRQISIRLASNSKNDGKSKVNKIFGIGLSRTGTTSLYYLMKSFGFSAVHYPASIEEIDNYFFCNDTPVSARFEELDHLYPNSKFIYTTRPVQQWVRSCIKRFARPKRLDVIRAMPSQSKQWYDEGDRILYGYDQLGLATATEEKLVMAYHQYDKQVKDYFKHRASDLLIIDLTDKSIYPLTTLVGFLERNDVIEVPQTNTRTEPYVPAWRR